MPWLSVVVIPAGRELSWDGIAFPTGSGRQDGSTRNSSRPWEPAGLGVTPGASDEHGWMLQLAYSQEEVWGKENFLGVISLLL